MAKKVTGVVTSSVQDKTIVVTVTSRQTHPVYGKQYTVSRKYTAHDEKNEATKGSVVEIFRIKHLDIGCCSVGSRCFSVGFVVDI